MIRRVLLLCFVVLLNGCENRRESASTQPASETLRIAVIPKGTIHEYWKSIHAGAVKAELELKGVQVIWKGPIKEDDREQQINVVENFVSSRVNGIAISPLDDVALLKPVRDATAAGVPVVVMDSGLQGEAGRDYVSYVATDNHAGGVKAGKRMVEILGGKGQVIVLRYQVGSASTTQREEGFLDGIRESAGITVVSSDQYGGPGSDTAYAKAEALLSRFPDVDGIFCSCEPVTFGVLRAMHSSGRAGRVKLIGFDPSAKMIQAMKDGEVHGIVLQDPLHMGYVAVKTVVAHIRGEKVPTRIDTGCEIATPDNMNEPRIRELLSPPIDQYLHE